MPLEERGLFSSLTKVLGGSADAGDSIPALTGKLPAGKVTLPAEEGRTVTDLIYRAVWRMEDCPELQSGSLTLRTPEGEAQGYASTRVVAVEDDGRTLIVSRFLTGMPRERSQS